MLLVTTSTEHIVSEKLKQANALTVGEGYFSQPRAIIVKLNGYFTKLKFMRGKRNLSGKRIYINEDLTKINHRLLLNVKELCSPGVKVYSVDGTVVARKQDRVYRIKSIGDLVKYGLNV